jgi:predicted nucleic acid-binding protein
MYCIDTSVLVAALTDETATDRAQAFLTDAAAEELAIAAWVLPEFSSALSIKTRTGQISPAQRGLVLSGFTRLVAESFEVLPLSVATFAAAARYVDQHTLGLRAGDALHLAVASEAGATLVSLDERLVTAGNALGASTLLLD